LLVVVTILVLANINNIVIVVNLQMNFCDIVAFLCIYSALCHQKHKQAIENIGIKVYTDSKES